MWQTDYLWPLCKRSFDKTSLDVYAWSETLQSVEGQCLYFLQLKMIILSNINDQIKIIFPCFIPCVFHTHNSALYQCMFWKSELLCKNAMFSFLFAFWFQETPGWQFETTMHCPCTKWTRIFITSRFFSFPICLMC